MEEDVCMITTALPAALQSIRQEQEVMHVLGDDLFDEHANGGALVEVVGEMMSSTVGRC